MEKNTEVQKEQLNEFYNMLLDMYNDSFEECCKRYEQAGNTKGTWYCIGFKRAIITVCVAFEQHFLGCEDLPF